jgi:hypothetical protein
VIQYVIIQDESVLFSSRPHEPQPPVQDRKISLGRSMRDSCDQLLTEMLLDKNP